MQCWRQEPQLTNVRGQLTCYQLSVYGIQTWHDCVHYCTIMQLAQIINAARAVYKVAAKKWK